MVSLRHPMVGQVSLFTYVFLYIFTDGGGTLTVTVAVKITFSDPIDAETVRDDQIITNIS